MWPLMMNVFVFLKTLDLSVSCSISWLKGERPGTRTLAACRQKKRSKRFLCHWCCWRASRFAAVPRQTSSLDCDKNRYIKICFSGFGMSVSCFNSLKMKMHPILNKSKSCARWMSACEWSGTLDGRAALEDIGRCTRNFSRCPNLMTIFFFF